MSLIGLLNVKSLPTLQDLLKSLRRATAHPSLGSQEYQLLERVCFLKIWRTFWEMPTVLTVSLYQWTATIITDLNWTRWMIQKRPMLAEELPSLSILKDLCVKLNNSKLKVMVLSQVSIMPRKTLKKVRSCLIRMYTSLSLLRVFTCFSTKSLGINFQKVHLKILILLIHLRKLLPKGFVIGWPQRWGSQLRKQM